MFLKKNKQINKEVFSENLTRVRRKYFTDIFLERIIAIWTVAAVIIVGFFGIKPMWTHVNEKRAVLKEMKELNKDLESNFETLDTLGQDLLLAGENLKYLYEYMPTQPTIQNYLVEYVSGTSSVGYTLTRFYPSVADTGDEKLGTVLIRAKMKGIGDLVDLAKSIEDLKRITKIDKIKFQEAKTSTDDLIEVTMEIYYLKDQ